MPRRVQYRHPQTGKIVTKEAYDAIQRRAKMFAPPPEPSERVATAPATDSGDESFEPYRIWTGGPGSPQEKIHTGVPGQGIKPSADYAYYITNKVQEEHAKKALRGKWWRDTVDPETEEVPMCSTCHWKTMSHAAMFWHLNNAHGRPQGG